MDRHTASGQTSTKSGETSTTNGQTNGQTSTTIGKTSNKSTAIGQASTEWPDEFYKYHDWQDGFCDNSYPELMSYLM